MPKVAIFGGGVAGVTAANELTKRGFEVDLIERGASLGGLHRSVQIEGLAYDIGTFVFGIKHELIRTFPFLASSFVKITPKRISITPSGGIDTYPATPRGYIREHGLGVFFFSFADLLYSRVRYYRRNTVPSYAKYYVGRSVYRRSGLKYYIERLYQMKDDELGIDFAHQRLTDLADYTISSLFSKKIRRILKKSFGINMKYTMVRPSDGFDNVYKQIGEHLLKQGTKIFLNFNVQEIRRSGSGFEVESESGTKYYDRIISTIPTPTMLRLIGEAVEANIANTNWSGRLSR